MLRFQANLGLKNLFKTIFTQELNQEFQDQKTEETLTMLFKKYNNQIKISLELTRSRLKKL